MQEQIFEQRLKIKLDLIGTLKLHFVLVDSYSLLFTKVLFLLCVINPLICLTAKSWRFVCFCLCAKQGFVCLRIVRLYGI